MAWYVAGEDITAVQNFIGLLDGWFQHKGAQMAREQPFEVRLHPHLGITLSVEDLSYDHWLLQEPAAASVLPMAFFEAQPVVGKRAVTLHYEPVDELVDLLIAGNTWSFRSRLDAQGVAGAYHEDGGSKTYFRVLKGLNPVTDKQRLLDLLGDAVFKKLAMRAIVDKEPDADSAAGALLAELRELPHLHWTTRPQEAASREQ